MITLPFGKYKPIKRPTENEASVNDVIDDPLIGQILTAELFRDRCSDLGYNLEIYTNHDGTIYKFKRIIKEDETGDEEGYW